MSAKKHLVSLFHLLTMFFKKLQFRSRSKSSSQSTKPSIDRITSSSSTTQTHKSQTHKDNKMPESAVVEDRSGQGGIGEDGERGVEDEEDRDYKEFLEKARREAERKEKDTLRSVLKARETNLSPWAGRM